jgi:Fructose-1-6-bisphosphatase, C-terminal domain
MINFAYWLQVADVHRTLCYGGWAANPRSHLRLVYEAAPLAFLLENVGGKVGSMQHPCMALCTACKARKLCSFPVLTSCAAGAGD